MSILLAAALAQATNARPRVDHTEDLAVVAQFLAQVRSGKGVGAGIEIKNWDDPSASTFPVFAAYASDCGIKRIYAVPSATRRLPIGAEWDCGRYKTVSGKAVWEERSASFWVKDGRVVRVTWGKPPPIIIPPIRAKTNG